MTMIRFLVPWPTVRLAALVLAVMAGLLGMHVVAGAHGHLASPSHTVLTHDDDGAAAVSQLPPDLNAAVSSGPGPCNGVTRTGAPCDPAPGTPGPSLPSPLEWRPAGSMWPGWDEEAYDGGRFVSGPTTVELGISRT
ncbi:hypothetical protein [Arthrobacter sp. NPDC090010]|uniref:hypothetical protein n=1 Tax=Arthrobacter sp. NPDC090010 TaxID=3363942 RepID=UPI0038051441